MQGPIVDVRTFGDVRRLIVETVMSIRDGGLSPTQGLAMAANFKELNASVQTEINAAKMAMATENNLHKFGRVRQLGTQLIGNVDDVGK